MATPRDCISDVSRENLPKSRGAVAPRDCISDFSRENLPSDYFSPELKTEGGLVENNFWGVLVENKSQLGGGRLPVGRSNLPGILVENNFWGVLVENKSQL